MTLIFSQIVWMCHLSRQYAIVLQPAHKPIVKYYHIKAYICMHAAQLVYLRITGLSRSLSRRASNLQIEFRVLGAVNRTGSKRAGIKERDTVINTRLSVSSQKWETCFRVSLYYMDMPKDDRVRIAMWLANILTKLCPTSRHTCMQHS